MNDIQLFRKLVSCNNNQPVTTSRVVADAFNKLHKNVIRKIETLDCSDEFNRLNFEPVDFIDEKGESRKEYLITRDGMAFLVMGFTGKEAAKFKEAYIHAFNWMAELLQERREIDFIMGDFTRREAISVSDGSFHGRGLAKRKADKASLAGELKTLSDRLQIALDLIER